MTARTMADVVSHYTADSGAVVWRLSGVDQVADLYEARRTGAVVPISAHDCGAAHEDSNNRTKFCGGRPADAVRMAREGWPDGERKLAGALKKADALALAGAGNLSGFSSDMSALPDLVPSASPAARWDLGDYMTGAPDLYREQVPPPARVLRLVVDGSVLCDITADQITEAAGALVSVIQRLQAQGVTVSVDLVFGGRGVPHSDAPGAIFLVPLISEGRTMELDRLAFWLSHPSSFRRYGFALFELGQRQLDKSYGPVLKHSSEAHAALVADVARDPCAILLPALQTVISDGRRTSSLLEYALKQWADAVQGGAA